MGYKATDSVIEQLSQREKEKAVLESELERLERRESLNLNKEEIEAYIENYYRRFVRAREEKDDEQLKPIVQDFVKKIIVHEEEIEVILKITLVDPLVTDGGGGVYMTVTKVVKYSALNSH